MVTTYEFTDDLWHLLNPEAEHITIRNRGGKPVSIHFTDTPDGLTDDQVLEDPLEIGGIVNELSTDGNNYAYAKAPLGEGVITFRPYGTIDPSEDITYIAEALNQLNVHFNEHKMDQENQDHQVTKEQVGLGNIPNEITDNPEIDSSEILATTKAVNIVLQEHLSHIVDIENPHQTTKAQVGLGQVENYPPATTETAKDVNRDDVYMTPMTTNTAVRAWIQIAASMHPQTVIQGQVGPYPIGWGPDSCSPPPQTVIRIDDTTIRVMSGLKVAFAEAGKTRESFTTTQDYDVSLGTTPSNGIHFIYANINPHASITGCHSTMTPYLEASTRGNHVGDFFSTTENIMYNEDDAPINRVYLAKVKVENNIIVKVLPVPIGKEYVVPVLVEPELGERLLYMTPFFGEVDFQAEVKYNGGWGRSHWNDQCGVSAEDHPYTPKGYYILQIGQMGYLASGREAGNAFGHSFPTVTTPIPMRVRLRKI